MIRVKGRNGFFMLATHYVWQDHTGEAQVALYSNSPHTQSAPVQFDGPPREVIRLFRQLARELEAENRNVRKERIKT